MKNRNNIDELFREGLNPEKDPVAFSQSDWSKLAQRLDRHDKWKRTVFRLKTIGGIAAIFLLAFSLWMIWPVKQEPSDQHTEVQHKDQKTQDEQQIHRPSEEMKTSSHARSDSSPSLAYKESVRELPSKELTGRKDLTEKPAPPPDRTWTADLKIREALPGSLSIPDRQTTSKLDTVNSSDRFAPSAEVPLISSAELPDHLITPEPKRRHQVALSILVAPAYNGVNNLSNAKTGSDVGLLLTLGLTKNWSFSTGAVYAKKLYDAESGDYNLPGNNGSAYNPQSIDADCRVLDIPLNLNYTFFNKGKTAISLGTGISSYIMLKENYHFIYANENSNRDLELVNDNKHWLSVLNLQANYERKLNSKISISVQPYLKIPFNDIGYAKVRLQSFGMALNATWKL
jgi:hypothetical protein